jgi:NTE family protein
MYYREIKSDSGGFFSLPFYVGGSVEAGDVWQRRSDIGTGSLITSGSLFAGVDTWFGPLFLGAGFSERGKSNLYLFLGSLNRGVR